MCTRHTPCWKHGHRKDKAFLCLCWVYLDGGCEIKDQHIENETSAESSWCFCPFLYPSLGNKHCLLSSERVCWSPNPNPNLLTVNVQELCGFWKLWNFKKIKPKPTECWCQISCKKDRQDMKRWARSVHRNISLRKSGNKCNLVIQRWWVCSLTWLCSLFPTTATTNISLFFSFKWNTFF